jgi:error-prone DNA polymerase
MPPAGDELLALWREAGEWWMDDPPREFRRYRERFGRIRDEERTLALIEGSLQSPENRVARALKSRDDKVEHACSSSPLPILPEFDGKQKPYALQHVQSGYAFGRSAMFAEAFPLFPECKAYTAVLMADPFSLAGSVEFGGQRQGSIMRPLVGATFEMDDGGELVLVARSRKGFRSLSRLITECHLGEPRLFPLCTWERLERHAEDLLCLSGGDAGPINRLLIRSERQDAQRYLDRLIGLYGRENVFMQIERSFLPWEMSVNRQLLELAEQMHVVPVAGGPITHRRPEHFPAQDMLVCIETLCTIDDVVGRKPRRHPTQPALKQTPQRALNAERYLRTPDELELLYADCPDLLTNTMRIVERCEPNVFPRPTELPSFCDDEPGLLRRLVAERAAQLPGGKARKKRLREELDCIIKNRFAGHFLVAWDMCRWAREQGIVLSGRGSVVDSAVAYCLGLSRIDAFEHDLHFDRFLPADGSKRPDIDIDFEARRRDDVRNYLAGKYGEKHVATVGAVGTYGTRGIVREVGKVLGIPQESLDYLIKRLHGSVTPERLEEAIDKKPELRDSGIPRERFRWVFRLAELLMEIPRNLRAHSSGVIISREPIADTVPVVHSGVDGVNIIQWDKRSAKHFFDKFDILCLRGNDVLADTQDRVRLQSSGFSVEELPLDDKNVFRAMRAGELIGVPQSASPAMRQAHIRLGTENLEDASIVQAAIRPGVGGAVKLNELIQRRKGKPFEFIHEKLEDILRPTYGIIVFQEQVDHLLQTFGGYTSGEAEITREAIYKRRREEHVVRIREEVMARIVGQGFSPKVAQEVYELVAVFQGYGFAEGHALAFADISIRSVYCQQNFPAEYFSALLDAQPAGYYGPCTLANEARVRGVKILPPNVNRSELKYRVEDYQAEDDPQFFVPNGGVRVSFTQIKGLSKETRTRIVTKRENAPFWSFFDFVARVRPQRDELESLILCGAFDELHPNRRALLWAVPSAIRFAHMRAQSTGSRLNLSVPEPDLPEGIKDFSKQEKAVYERRVLELDIDHHLMAFERERVQAKGATTAADAGRLPHKTKAFVVGNPIRLRFPPTSSGKRVMFFDLEDETGLLNVTCFNETYLRDGHTVICSPYVTVKGEAQERDGHIAFLASRVFPYQPFLGRDMSPEHPLPITTADFLVS